MTTNFPIIQDPSQLKRKFFTFKRDLLCSNKLEFICKKLKMVNKKFLKTQAEENKQLSLTHSSQIEDKNDKQSRGSNSPNKFETLTQTNKKKHNRLYKNFNRTKIDWDHNFVGNKYLQKIKEQLRLTKYPNPSVAKQQQKTKSSPILNSKQFLLYRQKSSSCHSDERPSKGINEEQLFRIRQMRQKRRSRMVRLKNTNEETEKKRIIVNISTNVNVNKNRKESCQLQKSAQISPWEYQPSRLSSILMKAN